MKNKSISTVKKIFFISLTFLFLFQSNLVLAKTPKKAKATQAKPTDLYTKAKKELPEDFYAVYRIVDRLSRANGLDNYPWRIVIVPEYNLNAFATDANLIAVYDGIMDRLAGDSSALACVIGHEMSHHVKHHIAMSPSEEKSIRAKIQQEAQTQVMAEINDAKEDTANTAMGGAIINSFGGLFGGSGNWVTKNASSMLQQEGNRRTAEADRRIKEITAQKERELNESIAANSRKYEFEADENGYKYMAKAGFEPEGCFRVMEVLGRTEGAEFDTDHPAIPKRLEQLEQLSKQYPPQSLALEGKTKISSSQPLNYDLSKDGMSLRINSRRGGSSANDIDRLFK
jgi:beta-barrel assembly-enhancing protease